VLPETRIILALVSYDQLNGNRQHRVTYSYSHCRLKQDGLFFIVTSNAKCRSIFLPRDAMLARYMRLSVCHKLLHKNGWT